MLFRSEKKEPFSRRLPHNSAKQYKMEWHEQNTKEEIKNLEDTYSSSSSSRGEPCGKRRQRDSGRGFRRFKISDRIILYEVQVPNKRRAKENGRGEKIQT